ncbi:helix-turn-helix transcriptional regulator [Curtobacterium ammoniigenes]|uniref:helix-turn-helix transcriptional regulator n=1 Tax=Curtobacterium ammoniigenes TaxID=395387 RepID=UPI00082AAF73|nr:helix-turn-helix transcriptional regulator [Curtobacterium ammoniigenes]
MDADPTAHDEPCILVDDVPDSGAWVTVADVGEEIALLPTNRRATPHAPSLSVDERAFRQVARELVGDAPLELSVEQAPRDAPAVRFWRTFASYVRASDSEDGPTFAVPVVQRTRFDAFVAAVLAVFPVVALREEGEDPDGVLPAALRRAMRFIDVHAQDGVNVEAIAEASGLSVRGLQAAFRRSLDRTPLEQLRLVRLQHAHDDLVRGDPIDGTTIEAIAARWGFSSSGRFAAAYRREFGVLPSATLRR